MGDTMSVRVLIESRHTPERTRQWFVVLSLFLDKISELLKRDVVLAWKLLQSLNSMMENDQSDVTRMAVELEQGVESSVEVMADSSLTTDELYAHQVEVINKLDSIAPLKSELTEDSPKCNAARIVCHCVSQREVFDILYLRQLYALSLASDTIISKFCGLVEDLHTDSGYPPRGVIATGGYLKLA